MGSFHLIFVIIINNFIIIWKTTSVYRHIGHNKTIKISESLLKTLKSDFEKMYRFE